MKRFNLIFQMPIARHYLELFGISDTLLDFANARATQAGRPMTGFFIVDDDLYEVLQAVISLIINDQDIPIILLADEHKDICHIYKAREHLDELKKTVLPAFASYYVGSVANSSMTFQTVNDLRYSLIPSSSDQNWWYEYKKEGR